MKSGQCCSSILPVLPKNWTCFCNCTHPNPARCSLEWFAGLVLLEGNGRKGKDVSCLITTPHYSWLTSRLCYQLQIILINSHANNLDDFNFIKLPVFKEHSEWAWRKCQCLYWQIQSEKKKVSFQIIASLFITPQLPSMAVQNLSGFKCHLLHIQSLSKEYFLELHHMQPPTPPHVLPTPPNNSGWQSNINLSHLQGYPGFDFDWESIKDKK